MLSHGAQKLVLHVDCDEFFLQVHERSDDRISSIVRGRACAVVQYNDVICANAAARAAGVRKHQSPGEASVLLARVKGRLLHAFWRKWPGPRVSYMPYQQTSRAVFDAVEDLMRRLATEAGGAFVLERTSIDECFVDITRMCSSRESAVVLARKLKEHVHEAVGIRVSIGVSDTRFLAKLSSAAVKTDGDLSGNKVKCVWQDTCDEFLQAQPATRLPGCGSKEVLSRMNIRDLQRFSDAELKTAFALSDEQAKLIYGLCRGVDARPILPANPPKSLVVSSWLAGGKLADLARTSSTNRGAPTIVLGTGKWLFEPHHLGDTKSNSTRSRYAHVLSVRWLSRRACRGFVVSSPALVSRLSFSPAYCPAAAPLPSWILLGLVLDLAERIQHARGAFGQVPATLTVAVGKLDAEPVSWKPKNNDSDGGGGAKTRTMSRSSRLSPQLISMMSFCEGERGKGEDNRGATLSEMWSGQRGGKAEDEDDLRMEDGVQIDAHYSLVDEDVARVRAALSGEETSRAGDGTSPARLGSIVAGLVDASAALLRKMDPNVEVGQLSLTVSAFCTRGSDSGQTFMQKWCSQAAPRGPCAPPHLSGAGACTRGEPGEGASQSHGSCGERRQGSAGRQEPPAVPAGSAVGVEEDVWKSLPCDLKGELACRKRALCEQVGR